MNDIYDYCNTSETGGGGFSSCWDAIAQTATDNYGVESQGTDWMTIANLPTSGTYGVTALMDAWNGLGGDVTSTDVSAILNNSDLIPCSIYDAPSPWQYLTNQNMNNVNPPGWCYLPIIDGQQLYNFVTDAIGTDTCSTIQYCASEAGNAAKTLGGGAAIISKWYPGAAAVTWWSTVVTFAVGAVHYGLQKAFPGYCGAPHSW